VTEHRYIIADLEERLKNLGQIRLERELTTDEWMEYRRYYGQYKRLQEYQLRIEHEKRFDFGRREYL